MPQTMCFCLYRLNQNRLANIITSIDMLRRHTCTEKKTHYFSLEFRSKFDENLFVRKLMHLNVKKIVYFSTLFAFIHFFCWNSFFFRFAFPKIVYLSCVLSLFVRCSVFRPPIECHRTSHKTKLM